MEDGGIEQDPGTMGEENYVGNAAASSSSRLALPQLLEINEKPVQKQLQSPLTRNPQPNQHLKSKHLFFLC
jgi:hypothetical protein